MLALALLVLAGGLADDWPPLDRSTTAIVDVRVATMDDAGVVAPATVLVADGRIVAVGPSSEVAVPLDAAIVDGAGATLLPGLVDMHVHAGTEPLAGYVAHGVTSVRNMWGFARLSSIAAEVKAGRTIGPAIYSVSPGIDGRPPSWPETILIDDPGEADALVLRMKQAGWIGVKLYQRLPADVYGALLAAAHRHGIPAVGHVPTASSLAVALSGGQRSIEHLGGYDRALSGSGTIGLGAWIAAQPGRMPEWAARTAAAGAWNCPTQVIIARGNRDTPELRQAMENRRLMIAALHRQGARLLAGSDSGINPAVTAGAGLLDELDHLHAAGLTAAETLRVATAGAAEFLGLEHEIGRVRPGLRADLLLVDGDPLVDLAAVRRVRGVMVRGRWIPRPATD